MDSRYVQDDARRQHSADDHRPEWYDERRSSISTTTSLATQCTSSTVTVTEQSTQPKSTNYVSISRAASATGFLGSLLEGAPQIVETFHIDPHLKVPDGILQARLGTTQSSTRSGTLPTPTTRSNASLRVVDGRIDVTIYLVADDDPLSSARGTRGSGMGAMLSKGSEPAYTFGEVGMPETGGRRVSKRKMITSPAFQLSNTSGRTTLDVELISTVNGWLPAETGIVRIVAPRPRPPFILKACCQSRSQFPSATTQPQIRINPSPFAACAPSRQPLTVRLPRSFRGLLTLRIGSGDISKRVWLSKAVEGLITFRDEAPLSLACFIGELDGVESLTVNGGEWMGDQADLTVEEGRLRVVFEDE